MQILKSDVNEISQKNFIKHKRINDIESVVSIDEPKHEEFEANLLSKKDSYESIYFINSIIRSRLNNHQFASLAQDLSHRNPTVVELKKILQERNRNSYINRNKLSSIFYMLISLNEEMTGINISIVKNWCLNPHSAEIDEYSLNIDQIVNNYLVDNPSGIASLKIFKLMRLKTLIKLASKTYNKSLGDFRSEDINRMEYEANYYEYLADTSKITNVPSAFSLNEENESIRININNELNIDPADLFSAFLFKLFDQKIGLEKDCKVKRLQIFHFFTGCVFLIIFFIKFYNVGVLYPNAIAQFIQSPIKKSIKKLIECESLKMITRTLAGSVYSTLFPNEQNQKIKNHIIFDMTTGKKFNYNY